MILAIDGSGWIQAVAAAVLAVAPGALNAGVDVSNSRALSAHLTLGQRLGFVFSRTNSLTIPGERESAGRISGTSQYVVSNVSADEVTLKTAYRLDGDKTYTDPTRLRLDGGSYCSGDKCQANTDGSSILYNRTMLGQPPAKLVVGESWKAPIAQPWELGPKGMQTVTVVALNDGGRQVMLRREGYGDGESIDGKGSAKLHIDGKEVRADVTHLHTTWSGYSVYRDGVLVSDELVTKSIVSVSATDIKPIQGTARQYVLMNAAPPEIEG
jgi:hypothetical protein